MGRNIVHQYLVKQKLNCNREGRQYCESKCCILILRECQKIKEVRGSVHGDMTEITYYTFQAERTIIDRLEVNRR